MAKKLNPKLIGLVGAAVLLVGLAYYQSRQDMKEVALICPLVVVGGDCSCFVDAFDEERGVLRGVVNNMLVIRSFVSEDIGAYMEPAAASCGVELEDYSGFSQ